MFWYSHLFKNFPSFVLIQKVKEFDVVNKGEVNIILELSCFFNDPKDVANLILVPLPFLLLLLLFFFFLYSLILQF